MAHGTPGNWTESEVKQAQGKWTGSDPQRQGLQDCLEALLDAVWKGERNAALDDRLDAAMKLTPEGRTLLAKEAEVRERAKADLRRRLGVGPDWKPLPKPEASPETPGAGLE